jgi:hypothetical protein
MHFFFFYLFINLPNNPILNTYNPFLKHFYKPLLKTNLTINLPSDKYYEMNLYNSYLKVNSYP